MGAVFVSISICVCVCVRERGRCEKDEGGEMGLYLFLCLFLFLCVFCLSVPAFPVQGSYIVTFKTPTPFCSPFPARFGLGFSGSILYFLMFCPSCNSGV